ncbi:MAG: Trigger factor [Candidatus Saccharibacteria bacterium]|nr:Trigger factor [Candidatus Saccharibacteria bacterium]
MKISRENPTPTSVKMTITADEAVLTAIKQAVISRLGKNVKVQGFRSGKAPQHLIEKQLDDQILQSEFLETAVNQLYVDAAKHENLRPVSQPQVAISKFVPYETLEVVYETEVVGDITLPDFSKLTIEKPAVKITAKDVDEVVENLRTRAASHEDVARAAKDGDQVVIDFTGVDAKTKEPIDGADGKAYPLTLGSKSFIPGFEEELIGLKAGDAKDFTITFPADYGSADLQNRKVIFSVVVNAVQQTALPKLDDEFAKTVGPFETLAQLKTDIKKQITEEREQQAEREFENQILELVASKTKVALPDELIEEEVERIEEEDRKNIVYRGQTWQEHLDAEGVTAEEHKAKQRPAAEIRVKAGLILGEIAEQEKLQVLPEELEMQIQLLKGRYNDAAMQSELDKPDNRRDIFNRILSQKSLDRIKEMIASK